MNFSSKLIESAVNEMSKLPGIGKKTALRLVLHLLKENESVTDKLTKSLHNLRTKIQYCEKCHNISDEKVCSVCANKSRDHEIICVVESTSDLMAIENTRQFNGVYHVLGGTISPIEGKGPSDIKIDELIHKLANESVKEVILALNATMESDTTAFYITRKLKDYQVKVTTIARGIPIGSELEYTDELTLGRSILQRIQYD